MKATICNFVQRLVEKTKPRGQDEVLNNRAKVSAAYIMVPLKVLPTDEIGSAYETEDI